MKDLQASGPRRGPAHRAVWAVRLFALVAPLLFAVSAQGQVDVVYIFGTVKDYFSAKKIDGVTVTVYKNGAKLTDIHTNASGKYDVNLDYGADYKLVYSKPGMVSKIISLDTRNVPEEERLGGHGFNLEMTLFNDMPDVDFSILQQPIGKAKYDAVKGEVTWDFAYTEQIRNEVNRLMKEYEDKKKREAGSEAEYAKQMQLGEGAMKASDFKKAVGAFTAALVARPADAMATAKLSDAQMRLNELDGTRQREEEYAALIKEGDALFVKKSYEEAKGKYGLALNLKDEAHPKARIKEIDRLLEELAKKAEEERLAKELNDKYQAAIAAGDAAFNTEKWDDATARYNDALGLKAQEKYPKDQLAAIIKKKEEAANKAEQERLAKELDEKYQAAVKAGDAAFKSDKWDEAATRYNEALGHKPQEQYPKDQLAAITRKKDESAQKAEEERLAKELDAKYQAAVKAGDAAFHSDQWEEATARYNEALGHKPAEKYPKDQLAAIQREKDEAAKRAEEERLAKELNDKYQAAIAAADAAFGGERWDDATARYNDAIGLKPAEKYPKDQLAAIQRKKDELAKKAEEERKQRELDEKYQAAIASADEAFGKEDLSQAKAKYQEAATLKPQERYPKDRLAEVAAREAELARLAEEERKKRELEERYASLISTADKAYDKESWSAALNDYKDALQLKPAEAHPQTRISDIEKRMDAAAQAKAEEERLAREREERDKRYNDLITAADRAFGQKSYEVARTGYTDALEVKPEERHPQDRLAEIRSILASMADQAEAERLAEEQRRADEERRRREQEEADAAERERLAELERQKQADAASVEARYNDLVAQADMAYSADDLERARGKYTEALEVRPVAKHPKDRIAAIDAELERRRLALSDAERLAEEQRIAEEERRRRDAEEAEARRLAEEAMRMERNAAQALEDRYRQLLLEGDEALAAADYEHARSQYTQALDIKPQEAYPRAKLDQIDKLLADRDRQREEAELAARRAEQARQPERPRQGNTIDTRKEQEAEQFMRAAREREEAEKYERIRKFRSELDKEEEIRVGRSEERRMGEVSQNDRIREEGAGFFQGDDAGRRRNAEELEAYREALAREEAQRAERSAQERDAEYQAKLQREDDKVAFDRARDDDHADRAREMARQSEALDRTGAQRAGSALDRNAEAREEALALADQQRQLRERGDQRSGSAYQAVESEKRAQQARETGYAKAGELARSNAKQQQAAANTGQSHAFADLNRSKLAQEYPPGVTEESYTEGNKVIIRRVVVRGSRADEYSKVIAKWGTFYFKNGQSISEAIWARETEG